MPRLDLIFLPLLGGYLFLIYFNRTKFFHQRIEKNRLIYNSLLVAFILISFVYVIDYLFFNNNNHYLEVYCFKSNTVSHYRHIISKTLDEIIRFKIPGIKQCLIVLVISYPIAKLLNLFAIYQENFSFDYTINKWGNEFDKIIWNSLGEKDDLNKLLMITTKSNKVYIGHITKLSEPLENTYLRIIPSLSGYREKDTHKLNITTNYTNIIQNSSDNGETQDLDNKLGVIIPISEVILISKFDYQIFGSFNDISKEESKT